MTPPATAYCALHNLGVEPRQNAPRRGGRMGVSSSGPTRRISVSDLRARKGGEPIVCLTAYTTPVAQRLDPHRIQRFLR